MKKSQEYTKKIVGWCLILLMILATIELASYGIYRIVIIPRAGFLVYHPPETVDHPSYDNYLKIRDELLGWPAFNKRTTPRFAPAFPNHSNECLSLYGDSFVYADDVDDQHAWGNLLSEMLHCPVGNFGVPGYGTDQAYLRFVNNPDDQSPITILGFFPENALRNVNQYRFFLSGGELFSFKPRFTLENDNLQLVPMPTIAYDELTLFFQSPEQYLLDESFLPDSDYGPVEFSFPYFINLVRLASREKTINWLQNKPSWEKFLQPGHPTHSLEITSKLIEEFIEACADQGKRCMVIIFPSPSSFDWYEKNHTFATQPLMDLLELKEIEVLNLTPSLSQMLKENTFCEILTKPELCVGHFNERGNQMIAEIVADHLLRLNWLIGE